MLLARKARAPREPAPRLDGSLTGGGIQVQTGASKSFQLLCFSPRWRGSGESRFRLQPKPM
jgi:hypothetical protein